MVEFQAWLNRQYAGWAWPFLKKRAAGLSLAAGATSLTVGGGNGGITNRISKIVSPVLFYTSDRSTRGRAEIVQADSSSIDWDETLQDSSTWLGQPQFFKARSGTTWGSWDLIPMPFPNVSLNLAIDYYEIPAALSLNTTPIYPSDSTLIEAIYALCLLDQKGGDHPATQLAFEETSAKVARDRATYGFVPGENDMLRLDSKVFK